LPARVPSVLGGAARLPPRSSVLPPGAGNQAKKAIQPEKERADEGERGDFDEPGVAHGQIRAAPVRGDHDGDAAMISTVEQTQVRLRELRTAAVADGCAGSLPASLDSATTLTAPGRTVPGRRPGRRPMGSDGAERAYWRQPLSGLPVVSRL